jgi:hypothetical protein
MAETDVTLQGGCLCGAIRYQISGKAQFVSQCCCKDCQKATGTGHTTIVGVHRDQLSVTGTPQTFTNRGESGGEVTRHFCGVCGGRIYTSGTLPGPLVMVQAGSLDNPSQITPESVLYFKDAASWDRFDPSLPRFERLPDRASR